MILPISEVSFNAVAKSSKKIIEFVELLQVDEKVLAALNSIPNIEVFLSGEDAKTLLVAMAAQDIVNCLDALFEQEVQLTTRGAEGLYTFFGQLNNAEVSYLVYLQIGFGGIDDKISDIVSNFRNGGINATTDEFKLAILLSDVNEVYLKKYWELIWHFGYYISKAESNLLDSQTLLHQKVYLNNIQLRAQKYFKDSSLDFMSNCENSMSDKENFLSDTSFVSCKQEENLYTYTIFRNKIIDYTIDTIASKGTKKAELQATILRKGGLKVEFLYMFPKSYWGQYLIDGNRYVIQEETLCVLQCKYTGENYSLKDIDYPLIKIKVPVTGQFILPYIFVIKGYEMDEDISFQIKCNSSNSFFYDKFFNIYDYCKISADILKKVEPYSDSLYVELRWNYVNGDYVHKNDVLGSIKIDSLDIESNFIALADGYFSISVKSFCDKVNKWNFLLSEEDDLFGQECLLYSIYSDKETWIEENRGTFKIKEDKDIFNDQVNLKWEIVANRYVDRDKLQGFPAFEMVSNKGLSVFLSFEYLDKKAYLAFGINSTEIQLRVGDVFSLLLQNKKNKKVLDFSIVNKPTQIDCSEIKKFDKVYYFELFYEDIELLKSYICTNWRISFVENRRTAIIGLNESGWTPNFLSGDVFQKFAISFDNELRERNIEIEHHNKAKMLNESELNLEDSCSVYLMHDTVNNFYKIGMSNNPEYREKTLQSEKPTIEMICSKEYPIRSIAEAFEAALHRTFASKRIRGEWFSLDEFDVLVLKKTLS